MARDRYKTFKQTPLGRALLALAEGQDRYVEYRCLSRLAIPAVAALAYELRAQFPQVEKDDFAKQALGFFVGDVMRRAGHTIVRRGRSPDFFNRAAIWSALPQAAAA
jgi:hypothetical protein